MARASNLRDKDRFFKACNEGNLHKVSELLLGDSKISIEAVDEEGETALFKAVRANQIQVVEVLISFRANLNKINNSGESPLYIAAAMGHEEVFEHLIEGGADCNFRIADGASVFAIAAYNGHGPVITKLMDKVVDINEQFMDVRWTALHCAAANNKVDAIRVLSSHHDIDLAVRDASFRTALDIAYDMDNQEAVDVLARRVFTSPLTKIRESLIFGLVRNNFSGALVKLLIQGVEPNVRDHRMVSPLHIAAEANNIACTRALLLGGADMFASDDAGRKPLEIAMTLNNSKIVELFEAFEMKGQATVEGDSEKFVEALKSIFERAVGSCASNLILFLHHNAKVLVNFPESNQLVVACIVADENLRGSSEIIGALLGNDDLRKFFAKSTFFLGSDEIDIASFQGRRAIAKREFIDCFYRSELSTAAKIFETDRGVVFKLNNHSLGVKCSSLRSQCKVISFGS